ncbi:Gfo/Idh/MocA family oxidoreductase [Acetobacter sp. TBRC 12305]|uniref:Gfo/Idh/MocA family oxidoreductase n=1 Tax=Acetobacter garciniae TaxID=2817435 RepID=A0A939KMP7_9PROT|nr:Gfo/Idh/MocA family oxidoreductase [Acetobacter garciniae]MBO1325553.1 Gfo/Idh/MocA family oxidoreductase [Acetobacter garciniae]MBX0345275.1 Gfo/Idh/MocA family oxidoreductase [Acetobacter garciniae]
MSFPYAPLKLGLIGCGGMGARHARAACEMFQRGCKAIELVAICDSDPAKRAAISRMAVASAMPAPAEYETVEAMLADTRMEAVDIVLPTSLHHKVILAALAAGKHVQVEKPLALTVAACDLIVEAARHSGRVVSVSENFRRIPSNRALAALLRGGTLGLVQTMVSRCFASPEPPVKAGEPARVSPQWYRDRTRAGGYQVLEMGVHEADLQQYWFGPVETVMAHTGRYPSHKAVACNASEDIMNATFGFAGGMATSVVFGAMMRGVSVEDRLFVTEDAVVRSGASHAWQNGSLVRADGSALSAEDATRTWLDGLSAEQRALLLPEGAWDRRTVLSDPTDPLTYGVGVALYDFARAVRGGTSPEICADVARRAVAVCCAVMESDLLRAEVAVADVLSGRISAAQAPLNTALELA